MTELMVVIAIISVILLLSVPAYFKLVPYFQLRSEAQNFLSVLQRARSTAANTRRPARVLLNCTQHTADPAAKVGAPCSIWTELATFNKDGAINGWQTVEAGAGLALAPNIMAIYAATPAEPKKATRYPQLLEKVKIKNVAYDQFGLSDPKIKDGTSFVIVFLPGGEAVTAWTPLGIIFTARQFGYDPARSSWRLNISNSTGHLSLTRTKGN
jgi:type II secretory pathway pseudopilin PulG